MIRPGIIALGLLLVPASSFAQTTPAKGAATSQAPGDKIRCHRSIETGSLVKEHKECHTVAEWRQIAEAQRANARDLVDRATAGATPQ